MAGKLKRTKIETSGEVRAFIYQKLHPFEPYIKEDTDTEVVIEHITEENSDTKFYQVQLVLETAEGELATRGQGDNVFSAVSDAADSLMSQISLIHNSVISTRERDLEIRQAFQNQYLH